MAVRPKPKPPKPCLPVCAYRSLYVEGKGPNAFAWRCATVFDGLWGPLFVGLVVRV